MNVFGWIWLGLLTVGLATEAAALAVKRVRSDVDKATASDYIVWLITGPAWWHQTARVVAAALLVWLPGHFGLT